MAATLSLLINIAMPTITQCVISSVQFVVSLAIDVVLSLVYQGIAVLGCGGCGVGGGGTVGALGGGGICTMIMGYFAMGVGAIAAMLGLGGGGVMGGTICGIGGFSIGDLIQVMPPIFGIMMDFLSSAVSLLMGLI